MTEETQALISKFISSFKVLLKKKGAEDIFREARLLDIRYRLTLDLRISIESTYSHTKSKSVRECYERLFRFLDFWNVYELCCAYGKELGVFTNNKTSGWDESFLEATGLCDFLRSHAEQFKKNFVLGERNTEKYHLYLAHLAELDAVTAGNKTKIKANLAAPAEDFYYQQLLFIQYMERNAYYHGGEAARAGIDYGYRKKQLDFYIEFLTEFIARMGIELFNKELNMEEK